MAIATAPKPNIVPIISKVKAFHCSAESDLLIGIGLMTEWLGIEIRRDEEEVGKVVCLMSVVEGM